MAKNIQSNVLANVENILERYGQTIVDAITDKLSATGRVPSNPIPGSVTFKIVKFDTSIQLQILTADFLSWMEAGRKAGKMPPLDQIINWVITNGIKPKGFPRKSRVSVFDKQKRTAFAIAKSIANKGVKRNPFVSSIIDTEVNNIVVNISNAVNVAFSDGIIDAYVAAMEEGNNKQIKLIKVK